MASFVSVTDVGGVAVSFADAVLNGWAPDGGMYWPQRIMSLTQQELRQWSTLTYPQLCAALLQRFVGDADAELRPGDIDAICASAFDAFGTPAVVELTTLDRTLQPHATPPPPLPMKTHPPRPPLHIGELWHGPTLAFKDLGMSILARLLDHLLRRRRRRLTLLVGTSGDNSTAFSPHTHILLLLHAAPHFPLCLYLSAFLSVFFNVTSRRHGLLGDGGGQGAAGGTARRALPAAGVECNHGSAGGADDTARWGECTLGGRRGE